MKLTNPAKAVFAVLYLLLLILLALSITMVVILSRGGTGTEKQESTTKTIGEDIDDCSPNPCKNEGNCTDGVNSHNCTCVKGFNGFNCENNIDDCSPNLCENGGTCIDGVDSYNCTCVAGYSGANCETVDCSGELYNGSFMYGECCSPSNKCPKDHGNCDDDDECQDGLKCGERNCPYKPGFRRCENCCMKIFIQETQVCSGENSSRRYDDCCSRSNQCPKGYGDCDGDGDCQGSLKCGRNNCAGFGDGDDCCQEHDSQEVTDVCSGELLNRSYDDCCSSSNRCPKDHGDCDSDSDCQDGLKCGDNNCPNKQGFDCGNDCCY